MNIEKWTAKMQEAIQKAITMASEMGHQVVDVEHFSFSFAGKQCRYIISSLK
mgnify:CR=1 FL=1